ncbi:alpha/beta hydrolase [Streptomyces sp. WMMC1477]|uniref:alpha/beta hydrolase n=1 Tax=Streptomyces sp. WMMC1477 TaxID=3015155 RepID=UPI0022B69EC3|nr:alpha/beta hydrolase [Streptomyces sp. WMMC1477]MCZ7431948.1 alpha/beta hydrolase [Streptomyces sp. WMMC1477]
MSVPRRLASRRALGATATALAATLLATPLATSQASAAPAPTSRAAAEPDTAALAGALADQEIDWETCAFPGLPQETADRLRTVEGLACATVTMPLDWHDPGNGKTIDVRISRTATSDKSDPERQGIALVNPGGPGGSGLPWGAAMAQRAPELAEKYDFIGFDPRGVGQSTPLTCTYTVPDDPDDPDAVNRAKVKGCMDGGLAPYINTEQTAYDMDFIRVLLGEDRTSYIGYSYGTWLGAWYAGTFPGKSHRFLLDSSTDVTTKSLQRTWDLQPPSRDRQFQEALLPYVARHDDVHGVGTDPMKIREHFERAGGTREFIGQLFMAYYIIPAMYDTSQYPTAASAVAVIAESGIPAEGSDQDAVETVVDGILADGGLDADQRAFVADAKADMLEAIEARERGQGAAGETATFDAAFEAIRCQDGQWNQNLNYWQEWLQRQQRHAPLLAAFNSTPLCAYWPTGNRMPKAYQKTFPELLVVQSELDAATAYEGALSTGKKLPGAKMISVDNEGSHGLFPYGTTCVDLPVIDYFLTGTTPRDRFTGCQGLPLPGEEKTYEVAGELKKNGKIKIRMRTDEVKEANRLVRDLLREANTPDPAEAAVSQSS